MSKTYNYRNLKLNVPSTQDVVVEVVFVSKGNTGQTFITVQDVGDFEINNAGSANLGKAKDLKGKVISIGSKLANSKSKDDTIEINYLVNGKPEVEHSNNKSEEDEPRIAIIWKIA